jgi:hypothetical protein
MGRGPVTAAGSEGCAAPRTYRPGRNIAPPRLRPLAEAASKHWAPPAALLHGPAQLMGIFCFTVSFFFSVLFFQCYVKRIFK